MFALAKVFSILVTVAGGLLAVFGKTTAPTADGKTKLTWTGRFSIVIVLLGGLASYVSDRADKEAATAVARIDKEWDELQSLPITEMIVEPGTRNGNLKVSDLEDFATKISLQVIPLGNPGRTLSVTSDEAQNNPETRFSLSIAGDGIQEPLRTKPGKLFVQYPGSKEWLCYWSMSRPRLTKETWACSVELSLDNTGDMKLQTLDNLKKISFFRFYVPMDFKYNARLYSDHNNMFALFGLRVGEYRFDISPEDNELVEHLDETKTPPVKRLEAEVSGHELLWRLRSQFTAQGGMAGSVDPKPFWWRVRFQIADWLDDFLPAWLSGHLPDLYPKPLQVLEGQVVGQIVNLNGYFPRPPNPQERAAFAKWVADQSTPKTVK